jgi:hypothetical protein
MNGEGGAGAATAAATDAAALPRALSLSCTVVRPGPPLLSLSLVPWPLIKA